jgi:hypothetical protein
MLPQLATLSCGIVSGRDVRLNLARIYLGRVVCARVVKSLPIFLQKNLQKFVFLSKKA